MTPAARILTFGIVFSACCSPYLFGCSVIGVVLIPFILGIRSQTLLLRPCLQQYVCTWGGEVEQLISSCILAFIVESIVRLPGLAIRTNSLNMATLRSMYILNKKLISLSITVCVEISPIPSVEIWCSTAMHMTASNTPVRKGNVTASQQNASWPGVSGRDTSSSGRLRSHPSTVTPGFTPKYLPSPHPISGSESNISRSTQHYTMSFSNELYQ